MVKQNQGISGQKLLFGKDTVFKYVTEKEKIPNLKSQYDYLTRHVGKNSLYGLGWIESGGKYGFTMQKLKDKIELRHIRKMVEYIEWNMEYEYSAAPTSLSHSGYIPEDPSGYVTYVMNIVKSNPEIFYHLSFKDFYNSLTTELINRELLLTDGRILDGSSITSYYHGDFTIHNMLVNDQDEIVPIDSNFKGEELWGSYLLDLSKMFQDVHLVDNEMYYEMVKQIQEIFPDVSLKLLHLLELTHYIRMIPYAFKHSDALGIQKLNKFLELADNLGLKITE